MNHPSDHVPPDIAEYRDQVMRRDLRVCSWLGLDPEVTISVEDSEPDEHGQVEVSWEAVAMLQPEHGELVRVGIRSTSGEGEPDIHSGTVVLQHGDAVALSEVAGPRPDVLTVEQRAQLAAMRGRS